MNGWTSIAALRPTAAAAAAALRQRHDAPGACTKFSDGCTPRRSRRAADQAGAPARRAPPPARAVPPSLSSLSSLESGDESDWDAAYDGASGTRLWYHGVLDYYALLGVDDDASPQEIKKAYRALAKECHPDFLGEEGHQVCILINEAYQVLSDPAGRAAFNVRLEQALKDAQDEYTGRPLSKWVPTLKPSMAKNTDPDEKRAVFVDEFTCIGCKSCIFHACATFRIEPEHGRSRVYAQWLDTEQSIQSAIECCPVDCIHWVDKDDLPALEYVMQRRMTQRTNVGLMMAGQGATADVWAATASFLKERKRLLEAQERASQQRAYSPAQEQARRAATRALRKKSLGVFSKLGDVMEELAEQLQQTVGGAPEDMVTVGKRKRAVRWDQASRASPDGGYQGVPPERALVPLSIARGDAL